MRIDGSMYELSEDIKLDKNMKHNIEIVVDRLVVKPGIEKRLTDSIGECSASCRGTDDSRCDRRRTSEFQPELFLPGLWYQH